MSSRELFAYALIAVLLAGAAFAFWRLVYNSEHNIRRRKRRQRRARHEAQAGESEQPAPKDAGGTA
jgi:hypothetical protein